jgi:hypothetical protein
MTPSPSRRRPLSDCFSPWEKLSAEPTDEGLMLVIKHGTVQPPTATSRTSSVMLRMTPSPSRRRKLVDRIKIPRKKSFSHSGECGCGATG